MTRLGHCALFLTVAAWSGLHAREEALDRRPSALPWLKIDALSATRDRPLFAPDRRKAAPTPAPRIVVSADQGPSKPQFALMGIIAESTATLILLHDLAKSETVVVRSGSTFGRWRLFANTARSVRLWDGDQELKLEMFATP